MDPGSVLAEWMNGWKDGEMDGLDFQFGLWVYTSRIWDQHGDRSERQVLATFEHFLGTRPHASPSFM